LAWFLDGLHEDLNENALKSKLRELTADEERRRERLPINEISTIEWDRYKHNHNSFLVELFQGQLISSLKCSVCGQTSTTCNAFMNLSIEISLPHGPQGLKLTQCIDAFVKEEVLEGDNAWYDPSCFGANSQELPELQTAATCNKAAENRQAATSAYYPSKAILFCGALEGQAQHLCRLSPTKPRFDKVCPRRWDLPIPAQRKMPVRSVCGYQPFRDFEWRSLSDSSVILSDL
jgi:Ubiquitin carboxyl-terminal hydrolase